MKYSKPFRNTSKHIAPKFSLNLLKIQSTKLVKFTKYIKIEEIFKIAQSFKCSKVVNLRGDTLMKDSGPMANEPKVE